MTKKILKNHVILISIILLGFLLRFINLKQNPSRMTHDAMSIGYNAFSILKTGKDEWGRFLPLDFEAFGDHKLPGAIYTTVPFIALFGLNQTAVALPSVLAGTSLILFIYFLIKDLTDKKNLALVSAFLISTSPWMSHISRMMFESNLGLSIYTLALVFLIKSLKEKNQQFLIVTAALLGLSFYFYIAFRVISGLTLIAFLAYSWSKKISKKQILITSAIFTISILPLLPQLFSTSGTARFNQVSVFSGESQAAVQKEITDYCFLNSAKLTPICRYLFNKPLLIGKNLLNVYTQFFLPSFLFTPEQNLDYKRNSFFGLFFVILAPLLVFGLISFKKQKHITKFLLIFLLLVTPLPTVLTGKIQIIRATAYVLPVIILLSLGWDQFLSWIKNNKILQIGLTGIYCLWLILFVLHDHFVYAPQSAHTVYMLPTELLQDVSSRDDVDIIYISKNFPDAHIAVAFYEKTKPGWYQENIKRLPADDMGFSHAQQLGKYQFGDQSLKNFLCDPNLENFIYVTHDSEIELPPSKKYKGFSQVHTHAYLYDSQLMKNEIPSEKIENYCLK